MTAFLEKLKELDAGATEAPWAVGSRAGAGLRTSHVFGQIGICAVTTPAQINEPEAA